MIKTVEQTKESDIFSIKSNTIYRIPKYQREYTWGPSDWDALFNDVIENESGYFLGSYICVNNGSLNGTKLEVIDGQQRFTTLMLLMAALYAKLSTYKDEMDDDDNTEYVNLRNELANKSSSVGASKKKDYERRLYLQKQNMNDEDFAYVLSIKGIISEKCNRPLYFGKRRIARAYSRFEKLISDKLEDVKKQTPDTSEISILLDIAHKFEDAVLVGIEVDTNRDAYMLFESLNHRGVPLSAIDLIKNTLIAQAEGYEDADQSYEDWKSILNAVAADDYSVQERFFRQYYNAFREELNKPFPSEDKKYYLGYLATRTTLLDIYEKMIKHNYRELLDDLSEKAKIYSVLVNNSNEEPRVYSSLLLDLDRISGAPSYILLLYILARQAELSLSDLQIKEIISILITFFVRRNITDIPNTRKLTQLFMDIISAIKVMKSDLIPGAIRTSLMNVSAPDTLFEEKLRGPIYDDNPEAARFLLCSIEAQHETKEIFTDLWARDNYKKYIWTIEHIFPEGENIPAPWVQMIADGDISLARQYREDYVHTLGNLTITGYNQNLSNMAFDQKRDRMNKERTKYIGYRNGLYLNHDVVDAKPWTIEKITMRTETMVKTLLEMYAWEKL